MTGTYKSYLVLLVFTETSQQLVSSVHTPLDAEDLLSLQTIKHAQACIYLPAYCGCVKLWLSKATLRCNTAVIQSVKLRVQKSSFEKKRLEYQQKSFVSLFKMILPFCESSVEKYSLINWINVLSKINNFHVLRAYVCLSSF